MLLRELRDQGYDGGLTQIKTFIRPYKVLREDPVVRLEMPPGGAKSGGSCDHAARLRSLMPLRRHLTHRTIAIAELPVSTPPTSTTSTPFVHALGTVPVAASIAGTLTLGLLPYCAANLSWYDTWYRPLGNEVTVGTRAASNHAHDDMKQKTAHRPTEVRALFISVSTINEGMRLHRTASSQVERRKEAVEE